MSGTAVIMPTPLWSMAPMGWPGRSNLQSLHSYVATLQSNLTALLAKLVLVWEPFGCTWT